MLKNITNGFIDACDSREIQYEEYIIMNSQNIKIQAELQDNVYDNGNYIGTFILKELKFTTTNEYDFKGKTFEYYKKVNGISQKIGSFITTEIKDSDTNGNVSVIAMDYGLNTQKAYTSTLNYASGTITLLDVWNEACTLANLLSGINSFPNSNFIVENDQFTGTGATIRDVMKAIALSSGTFVKIMNDDKAYLILKETTNVIIEDYTELDDKRDTRPITCLNLKGIADGDNTIRKDDTLIAQYGENWLIIQNNPFAYLQEKREALIDAIFNNVKGLGYTSFESKNTFKPYLTVGDTIKLRNRNGQLIDSIILRYEHNRETTLKAPSVIDASVEYKTPTTEETFVKRTEFYLDRDAQKIQSLITDVGDRTGKTTSITQDLDRIESEISEIADVTVTTFGNGTITFEDTINESEPIKLKIYPQINDLTPLYPNDTLYPSDTLYPHDRDILFINTTDNTTRIYNIPANLYYLNGVYDEFVLDYENQACYIVHRIEIVGGQKQIKAVETTETFEYPEILLTEGEYTITIPYNATTYIWARLMAKNQYTAQFSTKVETNSKITQSANEIRSEVSQTLTNYSTTTQMTTAINQKAGEITSTVAQTYETKNNATSKYAEIKQTTDGIETVVGTKVGNDEVISKINQSSEAVTILANRLGLTANDIINLIANNQINLTTKNITIASNNFNVDANGNMTCNNANVNGTVTSNNATITGGTINMFQGSGATPAISVYDNSNNEIEMYPSNFNMVYNYLGHQVGVYLQKGSIYTECDNGNHIDINVIEGYIEIKDSQGTRRV